MNQLKRCVAVLMLLCAVLLLSGCVTEYSESGSIVVQGETLSNGYFTIYKSWGDGLNIVYASDTGVMYFMNRYGSGGITPLYNADGSLQIVPGFEAVG